MEKEVLEVASALAEHRKRVWARGIDFYRPMPHQASFHHSRARTRAVSGGNRASKTTTGAAEACYWALGIHPYRKDIPIPNEGWVVSVDYSGSREIAERKIFDFLPRDAYAADGWNKEFRILTLKNGSTIGFKSAESGSEKFQGVAKHWIWIDEECAQSIYHEIIPRLADYSGSLWVTWTPWKGMTWLYREVVEQAKNDPTIEIFEFWTERNIYIPRAEVERMKRSYGTEERDARLYGRIVSQGLMIYNSEFHEKRHIIPRPQFNPNWVYLCGIDTGRNFAAVWIALTYTGDYIVFWSYLNSTGVLSDHIKAIAEINKNFGIAPYYYIDPTSQFKYEITEQSVNILGNANGIYTTDGDIDVHKGINRIQMLLRQGKLKFTEDLVREPSQFIKNLKSYRWEKSVHEKGRDMPLKLNDHDMDAMRYAIMADIPAPSSLEPAPANTDFAEEQRQARMTIQERGIQQIREMQQPKKGDFDD